jgi:hypothetical protein
MASPLPVQRPGVNYAPDYADPAFSQPSPSLPSLFKETPPLEDAKELPDPRRVNPTALDKAPGPVESKVDDYFPASELPSGTTAPVASRTDPKGKPSAAKKKSSDFGTLRSLDVPPPGAKAMETKSLGAVDPDTKGPALVAPSLLPAAPALKP